MSIVSPICPGLINLAQKVARKKQQVVDRFQPEVVEVQSRSTVGSDRMENVGNEFSTTDTLYRYTTLAVSAWQWRGGPYTEEFLDEAREWDYTRAGFPQGITLPLFKQAVEDASPYAWR